eukprot:s1046_g6.t1
MVGVEFSQVLRLEAGGLLCLVTKDNVGQNYAQASDQTVHINRNFGNFNELRIPSRKIALSKTIQTEWLAVLAGITCVRHFVLAVLVLSWLALRRKILRWPRVEGVSRWVDRGVIVVFATSRSPNQSPSFEKAFGLELVLRSGSRRSSSGSKKWAIFFVLFFLSRSSI